MRFYKQTNENEEVVLLLTYDFDPKITDPNTIEITEDEYNSILEEIKAREIDNGYYDSEISDSEALAIILGGEG